MIKAIIFDYDGVISESVGIKGEGFSMIYKPYGKKIADKVIKHHHANGGVSRYEKFRFYHKNFLDIELNEFEMKALSKKFSLFVVDRIIKAPYVKGAYEFLKDKNKKYDMFISTGTPENEIKIITKARGIDKFFKEIYGSPDNKTDHIKRIINKYGYKKDEIIFIGDSLEDKYAANQSQITFLARIEGISSQLENEKYKMNDLTSLEKFISIIDK